MIAHADIHTHTHEYVNTDMQTRTDTHTHAQTHTQTHRQRHSDIHTHALTYTKPHIMAPLGIILVTQCHFLIFLIRSWSSVARSFECSI